jgi:hypothetical protein
MQLWRPVEDKFQDILSKVTKKSGRSRLEPYGELIDELRARGLTYRDISGILTAELQFQVPKSTVNDFVRERFRRRRNAARRSSRKRYLPRLFPSPRSRRARDPAKMRSGGESPR